MIIRNYRSTDCRQLAELFYNTVHTVNAHDYTQEQRNAWATGNVDLTVWNDSFLKHDTLVAMEDGRIVGFGDIDKTGYLDRLYVHKDYQGQGIATAICDKLETVLPFEKITVHASITAKSFFEQRGYQTLQAQQVRRNGILLTNYRMEKEMTRNTPTLQTDRLVLRKFTGQDLEDMLSLYSDKEVNTFLPWFPINTRAAMSEYLNNRILPCYQNPVSYCYAVYLKSHKKVVGYIHIHDIGDSNDLGYALAKECWHQGLMTEGCRAVIARVKADGLPYLTATHDRKNPRSGRVMQALGMQYQYSYEEQWQPKDKLVTFRMYQINLNKHQTGVYRKYWNQSAVHFIENDL